MAEQVAALLVEAEETGAPRLPTRFGLNTGEVMVGNIGAPDRFNYAILGDPVNTAARIEGLNKVYGTTILVGARTAALVNQEMLLRRVDRVQVKGRSQGLDVYELLGEHTKVDEQTRAAATRYEAAFTTYLRGEFEVAQAEFEACAAVWPRADHAAQVLAKRCNELAHRPHDGDWDGTLHMRTK